MPVVAGKPDEETTLFVYGSLLDPLRLRDIIGRCAETIPAILPDYERGCARYFYIRKNPGFSTSGLLLLNVTGEEFRVLDLYEEVPQLYRRDKVVAYDSCGTPVRCWVYLPSRLDPDWRRIIFSQSMP